MGEALVKGLLAGKVVAPSQLIASDLLPERRAALAERFGISATPDNATAVRGAGVVILAVKPQDMRSTLAGMKAALAPTQLIISIAAGITTARIERELGNGARVVRVMPNSPAQIGAGAAALCKGSHATDEDLETAETIMGSIGITVRAEEEHLDAVTALSGSGPAYVFLIAEAMIRSGVELGLSPEVSRKLTLQTLLGAARLIVESGEAPDVLRHRVTSPGGTTEAALKIMNGGRLVEVFVEAVKAAATRSQELSGS